MGGPSVPKADKPTNVANTQQQFNQQQLAATQAAQQTGQQTQYGSLGYIQTGVDANGNPQYTAISQLNPQQQAILNNLQNTQTILGGAGGQLAANSAGMYSTPPDFSEAAGTQTRINMERQLGYLTPFFNQQTEQLDAQLRNQGLTPGTQAYDRAMRTIRDNQNQSVMSFLNQTQPLAFQQAQAQYQQPLQTIAGIYGLSQPGNLQGSFVNTPRPTMGATDFIGANTAYNTAQMETYKAKQAQHNAMMQGIMGIGMAAMGVPPVGLMGGMMGGGGMA